MNVRPTDALTGRLNDLNKARIPCDIRCVDISGCCHRLTFLEQSRENMARKDKVLTHYREQLKLNEDALRGHAEGRNDDKEVAKLKHSIAKLKAIIQAHEQKVKHG